MRGGDEAMKTNEQTRDLVSEFLAELDRRMSAEDTRTPEFAKERLRKLRPALHLMAKNEPVRCEQVIRTFLEELPAAEK